MCTEPQTPVGKKIVTRYQAYPAIDNEQLGVDGSVNWVDDKPMASEVVLQLRGEGSHLRLLLRIAGLAAPKYLDGNTAMYGLLQVALDHGISCRARQVP